MCKIYVLYNKSMKLSQTAKQGFAATIGGLFALLLYVFVGMLFLIPGIFLILKGKKEKNKTLLTIGIVLAIIGCIISFGMGLNLIIDGASALLE